VELEYRAWNPILHSYFFSMETVLVLFFYKTVGLVVPIIYLLERLPRKWRHEFNTFLRDIQICFSSSVGRAA